MNAEFVAELAEQLDRAIRAIHLGRDRDVDTHAVVEEMTKGWNVKKEDRLRQVGDLVVHRDSPSAVHMDTANGIPLVRWEITTAPRELTEAEREERARQEFRVAKAAYLQTEAARWTGSDRTVPPPPGVTRDQLLNQANWWRPNGDRDPKLLTDLTPEHRAALKKWLVRTAPRYDEVEFAGSMHLMPDEVFDSFTARGVDAEESRREMKRKPLYKALKALVKADRIAAEEAS